MGYFSSGRLLPFVTKKSGIAVTVGTIADVFSVTGGSVRITSFFGKVATLIGAGAATLQWSADVAGTDSALCAVSASIANSVAGRIFTVVGPIATAMLLGTGEGGSTDMTTPQIVNTCTLDLIVAVGTTGTVDWYITWMPIDAGAQVV